MVVLSGSHLQVVRLVTSRDTRCPKILVRFQFFLPFLLDKHNPFIKIKIWKPQLSSKIALAVLPKLKFMMCRLTVITLGSKAS